MKELRRARSRSEKTRKQRRNWITYGLISLIILVAIISFYILQHNPGIIFNPGEKRIAIIDGLSTTIENKTFLWTTQKMLKQVGYKAYYYEGGSDTIDFYRNLPNLGFEIIVLRVHSAINLENGELAIFTNEKWSDTKASTVYLNDILNDRVAQVRIEENSPSYFGITSNFVTAMNGQFENTVIIMMGCDGLRTQRMARAFIQKGATAYIGWDGPVTAQYVDAATIMLLQDLIIERQTIPQAVERTISSMGNDPQYGGALHYYREIP